MLLLLLLLELVELLSGLGVAIVVLDSGSSAQAAAQRVKPSETSPSLPPHGTLRHLNAAAAPSATSVPELPSRVVGNTANDGFCLLLTHKLYTNNKYLYTAWLLSTVFIIFLSHVKISTCFTYYIPIFICGHHIPMS